MKKLLILCFIFIFYGCYKEPQYQVLSLKDSNLSQATSKNFEEFLDELAKNDIILIGERHNKNWHRDIQLKIIKGLSQRKNVSVFLELFNNDHDKFLADYNANFKINKDLKTTLNWDDKWYFSDYKTLINGLYELRVPLFSANLTKQEISTIFAGALPLKGYYSTTDEVKNGIANIISQTHILEKENLEKMVQIQQFKDRRMAERILKSSNLAVLIAGRFHISPRIGIPLHFKDYKTTKKFTTILLDFKGNDNFDSDYLIREER